MKRQRSSGRIQDFILLFTGDKFSKVVLFSKDREFVKVDGRHIKLFGTSVCLNSYKAVDSSKK